MTETLNQTSNLKTVQIEGDKNGFNSKTAIDKFKQFIKLNNIFKGISLKIFK